MEQALTSAGFSVSDTPPAALMNEAAEQFTEPAPVQTEAAPQAQESTQPAGAPEPQAQGQLESEPSSLTEPLSGEQFMPFPDEVFGETPADDYSEMSDEDFSDMYAQLDPRIQVIADFVAKTGRSPEDLYLLFSRQILFLTLGEAKKIVPSLSCSIVGQPNLPDYHHHCIA